MATIRTSALVQTNGINSQVKGADGNAMNCQPGQAPMSRL